MIELTPTFFREIKNNPWEYGVNGNLTPSSFESLYSFRTRHVNDWKGFFKKFGYKPSFPSTRAVERTEFSPGQMIITNLDKSSVTIQDHFGAFLMKTHAPMSIADLRSRSRNHTAARFSKKAADTRMGLGEYLGPLGTGHGGEFRKMVDMCLSAVVRTASSITAIRRGDLAKVSSIWGLSRNQAKNMRQAYANAKTNAQAVSSAWLACRYGWVPVYSDVYGALTLLYDRTRELPAFRRVVATQGESPLVFEGFSDVEIQGSSGRFDIPDVFYSRQFSIRTEVQYQFGAYVRMEDAWGNLNQQLGLNNPASIIYQLTPGSFLLDWFTNIGDVLDSLSAFHGLQWHTGWETFTYKTIVKSRYHSEKHRDLRRSASFVKPPLFKFEVNRSERIGLTSPPGVIPAFDIGFAQDNFQLSWKRQVDALALAVQRSF